MCNFCPDCGHQIRANFANANAIIEELRQSISHIFPDAYLNIKFETSFGSDITIRFAFGKDNTKWNHGIIQNDPGFAILFIEGFDKAGNLKPKQKLEVSQNRSHDILKLVGKTGTADQVVRHIVNYFKKLKDKKAE